jgi:hypothetical protein
LKTAPFVVLARTLCLLAVWGIWLVAESAFAQEVVEQPTWSVGDWWEIGGYRLTVSARDKDQYEMIRTPAGKAREQGDEGRGQEQDQGRDRNQQCPTAGTPG